MDYPIERHPRSRFVTQLGIISIFIAMILIVQGLSTLSSLKALSNSPLGKMAEQMMPSMSISPAGIYAELFLYILGIAASIAMINRLDWGRVIYMIVISAATVWGIVSSIASYVSMSHYLNAAGMGDSFALLMVGNVLIAAFNAAIIWKLSTKTIKAEFL